MSGTRGLDAVIASQVREPASLVSFARTLCALIAVMTLGVTLVYLRAQPSGFPKNPVTSVVINIVLPAGCVLLAAHPRLLARCPAWLVAVALPLVIIWVGAWAMVSSQNSSAGGQLFFGLPVLFAAYQLRRPLALFMTGNAIAAIAVIASSQTDLNETLHVVLFAAVTLVGVTATFASMRDSHLHLVERLRDEAEIDYLTGLLARRHFGRSVDREVARCLAGEAPAGAALLVIDLDHLKQINDNQGHLLGDRALTRVAEVISHHLTPHDLAGRWGGDEFTVLCPDTDLSTAIGLASDLVRRVADAQVQHPGGNVSLSITVGVAHLPTHAADPESLYQAADRGLYLAKHSGRGRVGCIDV